MSKTTKKPDVKDLKQYYGIAKICFFIMVFNIVVRLDLWVSIAGLIIILPYLLQRLLLKKINVSKCLGILNHYFDAIKTVHQKPSNILEKDTSVSEQIIQTESTEVDFVEPSFKEIWQDCPPNDLAQEDIV